MGSKASVAVVKGDQLSPYELMRKAVDMVNIKARVKPGFCVFIKPNLVSVPSTSPYANVKGAYLKTWTLEGDIIHRESLEALLKVLKEDGIKNVTIGEASGGCETPVAYKALALYELAEEYGARIIDLNYADSVKVPVDNKLILDYVWIPKIILESDYLINLAALKVHGRTGVTLCLKNWGIGILPGKYYGFDRAGYYFKGLDAPLPIHKKGEKITYGQEVAASKVIADVCATQKYDLGVIDGLTTVHYAALAPKCRKGKIERTNMIIASSDMVALDAVTTRIVGLNPEKILHIKFATEKGLGVSDLSQIEVKGKAIKEVQMRCNPLFQQKEIMLEQIANNRSK